MTPGRHIIYSLTLILFISAGCAKQSTPTGGPIDENPPVVVKEDPPNGTIFFNRNSFEVTFDEYIVLDNIQQKLLVSPPLKEQPEIKIRGKTLHVEFEEELNEDMTYTFYFQDAIRDLNESNAFDNFQYVFSTGATLDSLSVTGKIYNAFDLNPGQEILVMLYSRVNDTVPKTTLPDYITKASKEGSFRIDNISGGLYSIFGLGDMNNNKKYDLPDEAFAFIDSSISITASNNWIPDMPDTLATRNDSAMYEKIPGKDYELFFFTAENRRQYLTSSLRNSPYHLMFTFSQPVDSEEFDIEFPDYAETRFIQQVSQYRDTIRIWLTDSSLFNQQIISSLVTYPETDSAGFKIAVTDTIQLRYIAPRPSRGRETPAEEKLSYKSNLSARGGLKPGRDIFWQFDRPVTDPDTARIKLFKIRDTVRIVHPFQIKPDTVIHNRFWLDTKLLPDSSYLLIADWNAFTDIWGIATDSTGVLFKVSNPDRFGIFTVNISGFEGNLIIQLLRPDEKLVDERKITLPQESRLRYENLDKGLYILKAIFDTDGNGKWTTGDYDLHRQPESVTYYPDKIEIKVNWELEEDWEIIGLRKKSESLRSPSATSSRR